MLKILTVDAVRRVEAFADSRGLSYAAMMQNAGKAIAYRAEAILSELPAAADRRVTVLVGGGNNGGDGLVAGHLLAQRSIAQVRFYLFKARPDDDPVFAPVLSAGHFLTYANDDSDHRVLRTLVASSHLIIDAVFGIGLKLPLRPEVAQKFREIRAALNIELPEPPYIVPAEATPARISRPYVLAVDCPSGVDCDTGDHDAAVLPADETITFISAKKGLVTFPAAAVVGKLTVSTIGVPQNAPDLSRADEALVDANWVKSAIPPRPVDGNKGTFGKVLVVGGSTLYVGAPLLTARAAYRSGSGLVCVATPASIAERLSPQFPEATWQALDHAEGYLTASAAEQINVDGYDALIVGMGLGQADATREFLLHLLGRPQLPPLVLDADALNLLSAVDDGWTLIPKNTIITPHPGEMARLTSLSVAEIQGARLETAARFAAQWEVHVLLKGAHTVIAHPEKQIHVQPHKTSALSVAGSGDVLAGIIGALLGQGVKPFEAASAGAYLHGFAGELLASQRGTTRGILASEIADAMPRVFSELGL